MKNEIQENITLSENKEALNTLGIKTDDHYINSNGMVVPSAFAKPIQKYSGNIDTGLGFQEETKDNFFKHINAIDIATERKDDALIQGAIHNAIATLDSRFNDMPTKDALELYFGYKEENGQNRNFTTGEMVEELKGLHKIFANSKDALAEFKKLDKEEQDRIIKKNSDDATIIQEGPAIYGRKSYVHVKNPNYDHEKARKEYEQKLLLKNTWKNYSDIKNNLSPEVAKDVISFVVASSDRSKAVDAFIEKFYRADANYRQQFAMAVNSISPELRAGFWKRVGTRIGEGYSDTLSNIKDYFIGTFDASRDFYSYAQKNNAIDENGQLTSDKAKLAELLGKYAEKIQLERVSKGVATMGGGVYPPAKAMSEEEAKKLYDEGKRNFELRKSIHTLSQLSLTKYDYSNGEWKTLEDALVSGEYVLRSMLLAYGTTALTKNPALAVGMTASMMYLQEASDTYADLRFNYNLSESSARSGALFYGVGATLLEQIQIGRFKKFFDAGTFIPKTFREYLAYGVKEASIKLAKEGAGETIIEMAQASLNYATKKWLLEHEDATYDEKQLFKEFTDELGSILLTMPIITGTLWGAGAPMRSRAYLNRVGVGFFGGVKNTFAPSDVVNNNARVAGVIDASRELTEEVKTKYGADESGREWLGKYWGAKTVAEKEKLLQQRFQNESDRAEAKAMLDQLDSVDEKATKEFINAKIESAKKREDEARKILSGDKTDVSLFDNETTDEKGQRSFEVLESTIDSLDMRGSVMSITTAQELADVGKISLQEAESIINNAGFKGFFEAESGKIIIIKSHFKNGADALTSFVHEYGHKIMKQIKDTDANHYKQMCNNVLALVGGENIARSLLPASYSQKGSANYVETAEDVAEETLMRVIEQVAYNKVLDTKKRSVWELFKGWFKKLFDEKTIADMTNEQLANIALEVLQHNKKFKIKMPTKASKNWRAKTPEADGLEVSGDWEVVDASELLTSIDKGYDDALQPRNRSRQSSKEQVLTIANNLDPERLDNDPTTSDGAPIIDDRNMVVSGNGRVLAIRQAYESGKADEYRRHVQARAQEMGIEIPKGIKNPVLIRKVKHTGDMSIEELASRSNKSSVAGMSVAEQAVADGRRIVEEGLLEIFYPSADGNVLAESNRDFNNAFLVMVGGGELYRNKDGSLRTNLAPRVKAAILCAMLNRADNREIVERLLDNPEGYSALINGLMQCASNIAELTQKPMYDISAELSQAVELYIEMHEKGQTVAEFSAQEDMFRAMPSDVVMFLCKLFEDNQRTSSGISGVLKEYALQCKKIDTATANLFGDEDPSKMDKLQSAYNHYATDIANQNTGANLKAKEVEGNAQYTRNPKYDSFRNELKEFFNKYPHRHDTSVLIGNTPNVLTILGLESKPIKIKGAVLMKVAKDFLKGRLYPEEILGQIGDAIEKPVFIEESAKNSTNPQGILIHTNLMYNGKNLAVVFRLNDENGEIHSISSIYSRSEKQIQSAIDQRRIRYIDRSKAPKMFKRLGLQLPVRLKLEELYYGGKTLTDFDLSQQNSSLKAKYDETRSQEELDELNAKFRELYEQYKNSSGFERLTTFKQALDLVKAEAERKGYVVKVYHGTGADGFNVAKADSSEEQNGEGNQAHGAGLYMAVSRDVAEGYKDSAIDKSEYEKLSRLKIKGLPLSDILDWKILIDENQEVLKIMFSEMVNTPYIFSFDEYIEIQNDWIKKSNNDYDRAVHNQAKKAIEIIKKAFKEKGIRTDDVSIADVEGHLFNWLTNLNDDNTLDEDWAIYQHEKPVQEAYKKAYEEDILPILKESYGFDEDELESAKRAFDTSREVGDIVRSARTYIGADKFREIMLKHGIKALSYNGRQDGRCYVSFEGGSTVKLQDPFTFDDNGNLIPLTERFDEGNADMRWKFDEEMPSPEDIIEAKRQYDEVVAKYKGTDQWLKAPNGKDTKLTEEQWVMVRTPNFKNWFGDWENDPANASKVIDENGEPLVVYHGTNWEFNSFKYGVNNNSGDRGYLGRAFYATNDLGIAETYADDDDGRVMELFLNIRNPYMSKDSRHTSEPDSFANDIGVDTYAVSRYLKNKGFDGVISETEEYARNDSDVFYKEYAVYNSNQIKSATDNVGTFSQSNDIRWKVDTKAEADAWASNPENVRKAAEEYLSKQKRQIVVDPDEIRKLVPNYDISDNSAFVSAGDEILEVVWAEALKKAPKDKPVVLLTGNPAAGKGTAKEDGLLERAEEANLVFDAPQNSFESVKKRVGQAIDAGHKIILIQIYNDPITSWENSLKRGIEKGRYLPLKYFVEGAYERAQGKVAKIENELKSKYGEKFNTIYVDSTKNNPILISPKEALAWDYSVSDEQLKQIENITYEYKGKIQESSRNRKDKSNPLAVITSGFQEIDGIFIYRNVSFGRIVPERISGRDKQSDEGTSRRGRSSKSETRLKSLQRQERSENPVYWASIVLAKEILRGRKINGAMLEKVLPSDKFDGTQRQYAIDRAKLIAEQCKATQEDYAKRLDEAVQLAEVDVYWSKEYVEELNKAFRRDGEMYGIVKQKLTQWLKDEQRKDLEKVKGLTASEIGIDVVDAIENALESEPKRKPAEDKPVEENEDEDEVIDDVEEGIDNELVGAVAKIAPANIRDIISRIRMGVIKVVKAKGGDEQTRRRVYRNTLVEVLREATKQLTYGKEREAILSKINELATKGYAVVKIKEGDRAGQKIDNYTLRAEHIALRIFNRGVRDTKEELFEKLNALLKHAKPPARVKRDDKRKMTGKSEERAYIIKQIALLPLHSDDRTIKSVENEIENTLAVINKADASMSSQYHAKLINEFEYLADLQRFGAFKEKTRAEMAEAVEWLEKFLESETQSHAEKVEKLKEDADRRRKIFLDAINAIERNAHFDSKLRKVLRGLFNESATFKDLLLALGRSAVGKKSAEFRKLVEEMMNDCYSATTQKENEVFRLQEELTKFVVELYGKPASDVFKYLLGKNKKLQEFSVQGKPMSVQIALQRLAMLEQGDYQHNAYIHCCGRSDEAKALEERIDELEAKKSETTDIEELKNIRSQIRQLENELETLERNAVSRYAEKLRGALSKEDLKLLDWFREFYRRERESLSNANEVITGLGVPEADPLYVPMKMLREGGTNEKHQVVAIVPKSLSPRVPNSLDMNEDFGIIDIWASRVGENAHYKAFSQLNIEWRGIFAHADFHKAVASKLGDDVLNQLLDHFNDIMSTKLTDGYNVPYLDKANGLYAITALGFNLGSGVRQMTALPAFANFIGLKNTMKYATTFLSKEGREACIEIFKSDTAKRRMQHGNNIAIIEALQNLDDNRFWAWYKRKCMMFNRWGDILPIMIIGQGIYRSKLDEYKDKMPIEDAKKRAMNEMWAIAEASQQSPSVMNMNRATRRGGNAGKALTLFLSSPQLMLSREVESIKRFISVRKKYNKNPKDKDTIADYIEARNNLAKTLFINHVLVQGGYMVATLLWKAMLGDDWEDDDAYALLFEVLAGPYGSLIVFGRMLSALFSKYDASLMPAENLVRTIKSAGEFAIDVVSLDEEEIWKDLDNTLKGMFAPYRDVRKVYKNADDKKEGVVW